MCTAVMSMRQTDIVARMDMSMGLMEQEEAELYLKLLKKSISGTLGKEPAGYRVFHETGGGQRWSTGFYRLSGSPIFEIEDMRELFYKRVIESLDFGDEQLCDPAGRAILTDIPFKGRDDELWEEGSNEVFDYIICCICPVKDAQGVLTLLCRRTELPGSIVGTCAGESGAGDLCFHRLIDRSTNIYNALYYSRGLVDIHHEFIGDFSI